MHSLNFFLLCPIRNVTSASASHIFTAKGDVNFFNISFNSHSGLLPIKAIIENELHDFLIISRHSHNKYCFTIAHY